MVRIVLLLLSTSLLFGCHRQELPQTKKICYFVGFEKNEYPHSWKFGNIIMLDEITPDHQPDLKELLRQACAANGFTPTNCAIISFSKL